MSRQVIEKNLVAIDNPSEQKSRGKGAGSYGRGFWVIVSCGEWAEIEVQHNKMAYYTEVNRKAQYKDIQEIDERGIGFNGTGTSHKIHNVVKGDLEMLSDPEAVKKAFIENFTPLILDESVHIEYVIDEEPVKIEAPDIYQMEDDHLLRDVETVREFEYRGQKHALKDLKIIESTDIDEVPWSGVALFKGNDYLNYPFMKVHNYKPYGLPSMRDPPKMFGWCDASDLCRDRGDEVGTLENNSHNEIQLSNLGDKTGLRTLLDEVHDNNFKTEYSTKEKEEMLEDVQDEVNSILSGVDSIDDMAQEADEGPKKPDEKPKNTQFNLPFLKCITDSKVVDIGDEVGLTIEINPEDNLAYDTYELYDLVVSKVSGDDEEIVRQIPSIDVDLQEDKPEEQNLGSVTFDEEGKYRFSGKVRGKPNGIIQGGLPDPEDTASRTFYVGERPKSPPTDPTPKDEDDKTVEFITDTEYFRSPSSDRRAFASRTDDGGVRLHLNLNWPEVSAIEEKYSGDEFERKQRELFVRWGLNAFKNYWFREELSERSVDEEILELYEQSINIRAEMDRNRVTNND